VLVPARRPRRPLVTALPCRAGWDIPLPSCEYRTALLVAAVTHFGGAKPRKAAALHVHRSDAHRRDRFLYT